MGEVCLAEDTLLRRTVALKVLTAELAGDSHGLRRFNCPPDRESNLKTSC
jgi:hypothetical protein